MTTPDKPKPLTPRSYSDDEITWRKNAPWLHGKNFKFVEVPEQIEVRKEENKNANH